MTFVFRNHGMGRESFEVLCRSANRRLSERGLALSDKEGDYTVTLALDPTFENDRYTVSANETGADLCAANDCALHAAFGRLLLESEFDGRGGFRAPLLSIDFTPKRPLRGMYFATHFYNFYHVAPIEEVYQVIEDLALRGCNNLLVWFDMHHYRSMEDKDAPSLVERLRNIIGYANRIGMYGSLTMLANEAFANSPEHLRAEWAAQGRYHAVPDSHYHLEICPNKEGGIEEILRERRQMLEYFKDLKISYICYWPYDQGGCTCAKCQPWGSNGFLKLLPHFRALVKELMPETELIVSTWYFDKFVKGEWEEFYPHLSDGTLDGIPYIMSFFFNGELPECIRKNGIPDHIKFIDFPEISMYSCHPWGGFGASVLTRFLQTTNEKSGHLYSGGFPYSEGIFEDVNKFIEMTWYSGLYPNAADAVRAYVKFEFCVSGAELDELTDAIIRTETSLARGKISGGESNRYPIENTSDVESVYEVLNRYNRFLPEKIRKNYRFRLFYLRAVVDRELAVCDGYPLRSEICQNAMKEINEIYHADSRTIRWVRAPYGV